MKEKNWKGGEWEERGDEWDRTYRRIWKERLHDDRIGGMIFIPDSSTDLILQLCQRWSQHAPQSRCYSKYTPALSTTAPIVSLFSHPFSSRHCKCYRQLVKVHYTFSSWPKIYTSQCHCHAGEEERNSLRMMTVNVSWLKWWILRFFSMRIYSMSLSTIAEWYVNSHRPAVV